MNTFAPVIFTFTLKRFCELHVVKIGHKTSHFGLYRFKNNVNLYVYVLYVKKSGILKHRAEIMLWLEASGIKLPFPREHRRGQKNSSPDFCEFVITFFMRLK